MGKPIYIFPNSLDEDPGSLSNTMKEAEKDAKNAEIRPGLYNKELKNIDEWLASQDFFEPLKPIKRRAKKA